MTKSHRTPIKFSSGIIPFRIRGNRIEFLLLRCFGYWDFPKGEVEDSELPWRTAIRELHEETSLKLLNEEYKEIWVETSPDSSGKVPRYYLGQIDAAAKVHLLRNPRTRTIEHHEYRWVSSREAKKLLTKRLQQVLDWAVTHLAAS